MSAPEQPQDPEAPIQLDEIDALPPGAEEEGPRSTGARAGPPPLPPAAPTPAAEGIAAAAPEPKRGAGKTVVYAAIILAMLAIAVAGGLGVGNLLRGDAPAASVAAPTAPSPAVTEAPAVTAAASAAPPAAQTVTLPTVEIR